MWETISIVAKQLAPDELFFILLMLLACMVYFLPRFRRDKNGKIYFWTQRHEDRKRNEKNDKILEAVNKNREIITDVSNRQDVLELNAMRTDIVSAIHNTPEQVELITRLYDEYKAKGGNTYIDILIEKWKQGKIK